MTREVSREESYDPVLKGATRPDEWRINIVGPNGAEASKNLPHDCTADDLVDSILALIAADETAPAPGAGIQERKSPGRKR